MIVVDGASRRLRPDHGAAQSPAVASSSAPAGAVPPQRGCRSPCTCDRRGRRRHGRARQQGPRRPFDADGDGRGPATRRRRSARTAGTGDGGRQDVVFIRSHPFPRGRMGLGRRQVSWLPGLPLLRLPGRRWPSSGSSPRRVRGGVPGHSGGSAPDLAPASLGHRPYERRHRTPRPERRGRSAWPPARLHAPFRSVLRGHVGILQRRAAGARPLAARRHSAARGRARSRALRAWRLRSARCAARRARSRAPPGARAGAPASSRSSPAPRRGSARCAA